MSDEPIDGSVMEERLQRLIVEQKIPMFIEESIARHPRAAEIIDLLGRGGWLFMRPPSRNDDCDGRFELYAGWPSDARFRQPEADPTESISVARFHRGVLG